MIVRASAPGKVVISGEYAVLDGATALVMAVDRRCEVTIEVRGEDWQFESLGFEGASSHTKEDLARGLALSSTDPAAIAQQILMAARFDVLPTGLRITIDSTAAHEQGRKLGIGGSASVCVALTAAFGALATDVDVRRTAMAAHRAFQGGRGSGLDVATCFAGGLVGFREGNATAAQWPEPVRCCFVFTGESTSTSAQIARFERGASHSAEFAALKAAADAVARASAPHFVRELRRFARALGAFDAAVGLDVYSPAHTRLGALAQVHGLVYKPCGAGGGDIGAAFGTEQNALSSFAADVIAAGFRTIDMELDQHGVLVDITR